MHIGLYNIQGLNSNFSGCESFLEWKSSDILSSYKTNMGDSIDSSNLSVRRYLPLIWKSSITNMIGLVVYEKVGHYFAWELYLENSVHS